MKVTKTLSLSKISQMGANEFKSSGYSLVKGMGIVKYIGSYSFVAGGYTWATYFYPDGKSVEANAPSVSFFIALVREGMDIRALFSDQREKHRHRV